MNVRRKPYATHAEPCPWCNTKHAGLRFRETKPMIWVVSCPQCGAVGPHPEQGEQTYQQAIGRWNSGDCQ